MAERKWSPERIEAMRTELLSGITTKQQIAKREGVSRQMIDKLVGRINPTEIRQRMIEQMVKDDMSDEKISRVMKLKVKTVAKYRRRAGIKRRSGPAPKMTQGEILVFAKWWYEEYGHLAIPDWNPGHAMAANQVERVKRYYQTEAPHASYVAKVFGSFSEMKRRAGLPPSLPGPPSHGVWKKGHAAP